MGRISRRQLIVSGAFAAGALDTLDLLREPGQEGTTERPRTVGLAIRRFRGAGGARLLVTARPPNGRRLSAVRRIRVLN
jgi:hypothetical protein